MVICGIIKLTLPYRSGQVNNKTYPLLFQLDFKDHGRVRELVFAGSMVSASSSCDHRISSSLPRNWMLGNPLVKEFGLFAEGLDFSGCVGQPRTMA